MFIEEHSYRVLLDALISPQDVDDSQDQKVALGEASDSVMNLVLLQFFECFYFAHSLQRYRMRKIK